MQPIARGQLKRFAPSCSSMSVYDHWTLCYLQYKVFNWWILTVLILSPKLIHHHLSWWQQQAATVTLTTKLFRATALVTTTRLHPAQVTKQHCVLPRVLLTDMIHMLIHPVLHSRWSIKVRRKLDSGVWFIIQQVLFKMHTTFWNVKIYVSRPLSYFLV